MCFMFVCKDTHKHTIYKHVLINNCISHCQCAKTSYHCQMARSFRKTINKCIVGFLEHRHSDIYC